MGGPKRIGNWPSQTDTPLQVKNGSCITVTFSLVQQDEDRSMLLCKLNLFTMLTKSVYIPKKT